MNTRANIYSIHVLLFIHIFVRVVRDSQRVQSRNGSISQLTYLSFCDFSIQSIMKGDKLDEPLLSEFSPPVKPAWNKADIYKLSICWALTLTTSTLLTVGFCVYIMHSKVIISRFFYQSDHWSSGSSGSGRLRCPGPIHHRHFSPWSSIFICPVWIFLSKIWAAWWLHDWLPVSGHWVHPRCRGHVHGRPDGTLYGLFRRGAGAGLHPARSVCASASTHCSCLFIISRG